MTLGNAAAGVSVVAGDRPATPAAAVTRRRNRRQWSALLYVAPAFMLYGVFVLLPALHTFWISLFQWDGVTLARSVGLENYRRVFTEPLLRSSILHALVLILFFAVLPILLGLLLTAILSRHRRRGMSAFRVIFFLPQIVPLVAVGITWRWMYAQDGAVNQVLRVIGLGSITQAWLGSFQLALVAVGVVGTWTLTGLTTMLFLSGAAKIDTTLFESARIDGAGAVREFFSVTLPALRGEISVALTVTTISALASFDVVYVTTNGSPGNTTTVPGLLVYRLAFTDGKVGLASALAICLTLLILAVVLLINTLLADRSER